MGWDGPRGLRNWTDEMRRLQEWGKGEEEAGSSLGSMITLISPGAAEGDLAGLPVPV